MHTPLARPSHRAFLSAHRAAAAQAGAVDNSMEALEFACDLAVDFVEFDVHRLRDGELVLHHDDHVPVGGRRAWIGSLSRTDLSEITGRHLVGYEDALRMIAASGKRGHLDFKFTSPKAAYRHPLSTFEVEASETALSIFGDPTRFCLTTNEDESVRAMREWTDTVGIPTLVGLSLGRQPDKLTRRQQVTTRVVETFPAGRFRRCRANLVVVHHRLADLNVLRWADRQGLPVLVWTVDDEPMLHRFLTDERVWLVTSNHPARSASAFEGEYAVLFPGGYLELRASREEALEDIGRRAAFADDRMLTGDQAAIPELLHRPLGGTWTHTDGRPAGNIKPPGRPRIAAA